jgi:hypothetical protein
MTGMAIWVAFAMLMLSVSSACSSFCASTLSTARGCAETASRLTCSAAIARGRFKSCASLSATACKKRESGGGRDGGAAPR